MPERIDFDALTENQRHVLGCVAMGQDGGHARASLLSLEKRGLIAGEDVEMRGNGRSPIDRIPMKVRRYYVPIPVRIQWCEWCSEHCEEVE